MILTVQNNRILARDSYAQKDTLKALGMRWNNGLKAWVLPATPMAAKRVSDAFPNGLARREACFSALVDAAEHQVKTVATIREAEDLPEIPATIHRPWLHQLRAYHFAKNLPAAMLAMDMGCGKTKVAVDLVTNLEMKHILIVCPLSVVPVWAKEFAKHSPAPVMVASLDRGLVARRALTARTTIEAADKLRRPCAVVINYDSVWREDFELFLASVTWDLCILDESHRIKDRNGRAAKFFAKHSYRFPRRLCLTGTPMPHSPIDLFSQYRFLEPSIFGTIYKPFEHRYVIKGGYMNHEVKGFTNQDEFREKYRSIAFRVEADEVLDLPPEQHLTRTCRLEGDAARVYAELHADAISWIKSSECTATNALTKLLRLQQVTGGHITDDGGLTVPFDHNAKASLLRDIVQDIDAEEPLAVFCRFIADANSIQKVLESEGRSVGRLAGPCNDLAAWQRGELNSLVVQIQKGGVGVDLTRARYCLYYSLGFSLGDYLQSLRRVHRPGQTRPVVYYHLLAEKTVDEHVYRCLAARQEIVQAIMAEIRQE